MDGSSIVGALGRRWLRWAALSLLGPIAPVLGLGWLFLVLLMVVFSLFGGSGPAPTSSAAEIRAVRVTYLPLEQHAVKKDCPPAAHVCAVVTVPFVQAIMMQDSGGYPRAVSPAHPPALGLMQVEPSHFPRGANPFNPATNIQMGVRILDAAAGAFGGDLELTAYNAGTGGVQQLERWAGATNWPAIVAYIQAHPSLKGYWQTVHYVPAVMRPFAAFQQPYQPPLRRHPRCCWRWWVWGRRPPTPICGHV